MHNFTDDWNLLNFTLLKICWMCFCFWQHFETDTRDMAGLEWSPDGSVLCVWDSLLEVRLCHQFKNNSLFL